MKLWIYISRFFEFSIKSQENYSCRLFVQYPFSSFNQFHPCVQIFDMIFVTEAYRNSDHQTVQKFSFGLHRRVHHAKFQNFITAKSVHISKVFWYICENMAFSHRQRYIHLSLASHSMKYRHFPSGLTPSFATSSKHYVQSGITDQRHSHFLISYYRLIFQSNLFTLVPYLLQRMQYETSLDQR